MRTVIEEYSLPPTELARHLTVSPEPMTDAEAHRCGEVVLRRNVDSVDLVRIPIYERPNWTGIASIYRPYDGADVRIDLSTQTRRGICCEDTMSIVVLMHEIGHYLSGHLDEGYVRRGIFSKTDPVLCATALLAKTCDVEEILADRHAMLFVDPMHLVRAHMDRLIVTEDIGIRMELMNRIRAHIIGLQETPTWILRNPAYTIVSYYVTSPGKWVAT